MKKKKARLVFFLLWLAPAVALCEAQSSPSEPAAGASSALDFANGLYARRMYQPAISEYDKFIRTHPGSAEVASAYFRMADSYYFMKEYKEAVSRFSHFIYDYPTDKRVSIARFRLATAHYYLKNYRSAHRLCLRLIRDATDPSVRVGAFFYLAKVNEGQKRLQRTVAIFNRIVAAYPQSEYATYAAYALGETFANQNKETEALEAYQAASQKTQPVNLVREALLKTAEIYFKRKDYASARATYKKLMDSVPADANGRATNKKAMLLLDEALLGIFYCDYGAGHFPDIWRLAKEHEAFIDTSRYQGEILLLLGSVAADEKNKDLAISYLDRILYDPKYPEELRQKALFKKAKVLQESGQKEAAVEELSKIETAPTGDKSRARFEKALIYTELEKYNEALKAYSDILQNGESKDYSRLALFQMAMMQLKTRDFKSGRENLEKYVTLYPTDIDAEKAYLELIQLDLGEQRFEKSAHNASKFIHLYPKSRYLDVAHFKLGMAMTGLKNYNEASQSFEKVVNGYPQSVLLPEAIYGAAVSYDKRREWPKAILYYERFLKEYPAHALFKEVFLRTGFLYMQTENFEKAASHYEDLFFHRSGFEASPEVAFWLVRYRIDRAQYEEAKKILELLPNRYPSQDIMHGIYFFKGEVYLGLGQFKEAMLHYEKAVGADPDGAYVPYCLLGMGIANVSLNDLAAAENNFSQALRYDYEAEVAVRARYEIANLRLRTGNLIEAAKAFMMVAILYDEKKYCPVALFKAGECFLKLLKLEEARQAFDELERRYPDSEWTKKIPKDDVHETP